MIGVIGMGFVGSAVIESLRTEYYAVDPAHNENTIEELVRKWPLCTFVCLPTPTVNGKCNADVVREVLVDLEARNYEGLVILKSTITPDYIAEFEQLNLKMVYNPEFLRQEHAYTDLTHPKIQVFGGDQEFCQVAERIYYNMTQINTCPTFYTDMQTASLIKYTVNTFLATKVTFMNEMYHLFKTMGTSDSWEEFTQVLEAEGRLGTSHFQVPGPDGKFGFGGACFPKDTAAISAFATKVGANLTVLDHIIEANYQQRGKDG